MTPDELKQVAERYIAGATVYELAAEFGCHRGTIAERLKLAGVTLRHQSTTTEQVDEIVRLYESGLSMAKVAERVGVSPRTVFNYLQERGVSTRDVHGRRKPLSGPESPECGLNE